MVGLAVSVVASAINLAVGLVLVRAGRAHRSLRTHQAGHRAFISTHVLVPGDWTVQRGHDLVEEVEAAPA